MPKADEEQFVKFYYFWKWEYTRRNNKYNNKVKRTMAGEKGIENIWGEDVLYRSIEDVTILIGDFILVIPDKLSSAEITEIEADFELPSYTIKTAHYLPKVQNNCDGTDQVDKNTVDIFLYASSCEIISCLLKNKFIYKFPDVQIDKSLFRATRYIDKEMYSIIPFQTIRDYHNGKCDLPHIDGFEDSSFCFDLIATARKERDEIDIKDGEEIFIVNLDSDLEQIVNEISFHKKRYQGERDFKFERDNILSRGSSQRKSRDLPRAVGLWLWDYVNKNNISWEHRSKAYNAFHEIYHSPDSQKNYIKAYTSDQKLGSLLDITNNCIEKMDVLPMW